MAEQNNSYPMISEKTWWTIREKFQATVPSVVSTTYIKSLLTLGSDNSATSNVISPLKRMALIDSEGKPTPPLLSKKRLKSFLKMDIMQEQLKKRINCWIISSRIKLGCIKAVPH